MIDEDRSLDLALNERGVLRELIDSAGWKLLMTIADAQTAVKRNQMNVPCTLEDFPRQEFSKGEAAGIQLFQRMPFDAIESLTPEIEMFKQQLGLNEEDEESEDATRNAP
jgi:hypothetical protein